MVFLSPPPSHPHPWNKRHSVMPRSPADSIRTSCRTNRHQSLFLSWRLLFATAYNPPPHLPPLGEEKENAYYSCRFFLGGVRFKGLGAMLDWLTSRPDFIRGPRAHVVANYNSPRAMSGKQRKVVA